MKFLFSILFLISCHFSFSQTEATTEKPKDSLSTTVPRTKKPPRTIKDFYKFIGDNFRTPYNDNFVGGKMIVEFFVLRDGNLVDIKVLKDLGYGSGPEMIRVIKKYGKWTPSNKPDAPESVKYTMPFVIQGSY